jgi:4-aminobutyrate aminotransferase-like enzyme
VPREIMTTTVSAKPPATGDDVQRLLARRREFMGPQFYMFYDPPLHLVRGEGVWLHDAQGRAYLDAYNNVPHVGHGHPQVVEAIARQAAKLNTNTRYLYDEVLDYAERLTATLPAGLDVAAFVNSGSEAVDLAWRMAKVHTGQQGAVVMAEAYHGWTDAVDALSPAGKPEGARAPHVRALLAPDVYRGPFGADAPDRAARYAEDADRAVESLAAAALRPAAFIADPGFCTNGILEAPAGYLARVFEKMRAAGAVCIADEVQTGFGRVGAHMWGFGAQGAVPDMVTLGKPVANGYPLGVVVMRREIMESFMSRTSFFSTFGGSNVACAAGMAVLEVLERERLQDNARKVGEHLKAGLRKLQHKHDLIGDVRGLGLVIGVDLVIDRKTKAPAGKQTKRVLNLMRDAGVLVGYEGRAANIVKIRPPMPFKIEHADRTVDALDRALGAL